MDCKSATRRNPATHIGAASGHLSGMDDAAEHVLLCDACAHEAGMNDEAHAVPPGPELAGTACQRCGAQLVGFAYRVPADVYTGMAPGAG